MAFNFQPIINTSALQQKTNNDYQLSKAGLDSVFNGIGGFADSIKKLGEWKKTMDERDARLQQRNKWDEAYGNAKGIVDTIGAEKFDVNSVDRTPFRIAPVGSKLTEGAEEIGDTIRFNGTDYDKELVKNGNYEDIGLGYSKPVAEGFDQQGYDKAVADAMGVWQKGHDERMKGAKANLEKYGWNDMNNPAVNAAWDEYVRTGNSALISNLQTSYNNELARKAMEAKLEAEKKNAADAANRSKVASLGRDFNTAISDYRASKALNDNDGLLMAENGKARMENIISELGDMGYDTSALEEEMAGAVGEKVDSIRSNIEARKRGGLKKKGELDAAAKKAWDDMPAWQKTRYNDDYNEFRKQYKG